MKQLTIRFVSGNEIIWKIDDRTDFDWNDQFFILRNDDESALGFYPLVNVLAIEIDEDGKRVTNEN